MNSLNKHADKFFYLYADCVPVKGHARSTLNDLTKRDIHFIPNSYYPLFEVFKKHTIGEILSFMETESDENNFSSFVHFLLQYNLGTFVSDISLFPELPLEWDHPSFIANAIVDCRDHLHDFRSIFHQLDELGCKNCQVRLFSEFSLEEIEKLSDLMPRTSSFQGYELYVKHTAELTEEALRNIVHKNKMLTLLVVHSAPRDAVLLSEWHKDGMVGGKILQLQQQINSCDSCGIINLKSLHVPNQKGYAENRNYNSCLNRKIGIDVEGYIKNCPSMRNHFGNIRDTTLRQAISHPDFVKAGSVHKDQVKTCRDCEFRYICIDCRAYLSDDADPLSKPAKCSYNPYITVWEA